MGQNHRFPSCPLIGPIPWLLELLDYLPAKCTFPARNSTRIPKLCTVASEPPLLS